MKKQKKSFKNKQESSPEKWVEVKISKELYAILEVAFQDDPIPSNFFNGLGLVYLERFHSDLLVLLNEERRKEYGILHDKKVRKKCGLL